MADSNITKQALAQSLKDLMQEEPFDKINVVDICDRCNMSRKSFYYHFKDKYDLVNWIFDRDFMLLTRGKELDRWELFEVLCTYFYENRSFYRRLLNVHGQNSFMEHYREFLYPIMRSRLESIVGHEEILTIYIDFLTDALICATVRWLQDKHCLPPEQFVKMMKSLVLSAAKSVMEQEELE